MCDLLSGFVNVKTGDLECRDLTSHSGTQEAMRWSTSDLADWREWEWTDKGLVVRVAPGDEHDAKWHASAIEARFPRRIDAINWAIARVNAHGGYLDLGSLTSAKGLTLPQTVGGSLYLGSLTSAKGDAVLAAWRAKR